MVWFLWKARNAAKFHDEQWVSIHMIHQVKLYANDIHKVLIQNIKNQLEKRATRVYRRKPDCGWYKINIDGSFHKLGGTRDPAVDLTTSGEFQWMIIQPLTFGDAFFAECQPCRMGLEVALLKGYTKVHIEVDSQSLSNLITRKEKQAPLSTTIMVEDIRSLSTNFHGFKASWIFCEGNEVANKGANLVALQAQDEAFLLNLNPFKI